MISFPPCKINLGLHILERRQDGFHNIETCFYPVPWTDILEIIPSEKFSFTSSGLPIDGSSENNLCVKAYNLLASDFGLSPVSIHLHKVLPMGAGLGGGSSDAAFTLRSINEVFSLKLSDEVLLSYADKLGSDCGFFLSGKPMLGTGKGNDLKPIDISLKGKFLVIVKPSVHVATAAAYAGVKPRTRERNVVSSLALSIDEWKQSLENQFEETVFKSYSAIGLIKDKLYGLGADYAAMSGSGSAVFGIFSSNIQLNREFPDCVTWSGILSI